MDDKQLIISLRTILLFLGTLIGLWVFWLIRDVVLIFFISLILALTLEPFVEWLDNRKIPRPISVVVNVLVVILAFVGVGSVAVIPLQQISRLIVSLPSYLDSLTKLPILDGFQIQLNDAIYAQLSQTTGNIVTATLGAFSGLLTVVVVIVFTVYILLDFDNLRKMFISFSLNPIRTM